ncbi:MAG: hypothetical protein M3367_19220 [Acidobacteriota bacterium]|nr:hypothetical protein [Acidobacteriota bacterium]
MSVLTESIPKLHSLPISLPRENAVEIELEAGVMIFRASATAQSRIEYLLLKQKESRINEAEENELRQYEKIDDYLSFLNRLTRNLAEPQNEDVQDGA